MLARLCQLKSLLLLIVLVISGCTYFRTQKNHDSVELMNSLENNWFSKNIEHSLRDQSGKPQPHQFFDVNPEISKDDVHVNGIIVIPENSDHSYQLDLASGQRYYSHSFCPQHDIWNQYSGAVGKPTFSVGVIPRLLDQMGEPQKVVIFGGAQKFAKFLDHHEHRLKLVGAYIEQTCLDGNCLGKSNWISRMVFLAVDSLDKKYDLVNDITTLKTLIKWPLVKATLENMEGRNGGTNASYPAIRIGNLIALNEAMDYYKKRSIYLSDKESQKIQNGCYALYEKLWNDVGVHKKEDQPARTLDELKAKVKLVNDLKKQKMPVGFAARFRKFIKQYFNEYTTCTRFVYSGNVNQNLEKFWFLNYANIFLRLHKDGYYFDCKSRQWQKNVLNSEGEQVYNIKTGIDSCKDKDFDLAMDYLPNFLTGLKLSDAIYYRFDDYDTHTFGTHHKLYSWVKVSAKKFDCGYNPNVAIKKEIKVFPEDVSWKIREIKDLEDELKIIY
jgi:hypothetical protein